jgi:ketosteroid isomerase-like protein
VTEDREAMLRRGLDAWNRDDIDGLLELLEPDVGIHLSGAFPGLDREYRGHQGMREFWGEMHDMWDPLEMEGGEIEPLDEFAVAPITFRATGREGIQVERVFYFVWQFDEETSKVSAYSSHQDRESAVEAARAAQKTGGLRA